MNYTEAIILPYDGSAHFTWNFAGGKIRDGLEIETGRSAVNLYG